jgi:hypothetical protein
MASHGSRLKLLGITTPVLLIAGLGLARIQAVHAQSKGEGIQITKRAKAPLIQGRAATSADVDSGAAIFYVEDGRSKPYFLGRRLPVAAEIVKPDSGVPVGRHIKIVQAEITDGTHVTLGALDGDKPLVCALEDVKLHL